MLGNEMRRLGIGIVVAIIACLSITGCVSTPFVSEALNNQIPVSDPSTDDVFESVCHLDIRRRIGGVWPTSFTGTAVLYRARYLLTAGHNVYKDWSSIRGVDVRCGVASARSSPIHETIEAWQATDASGYAGKYIGRFPRDFGVIRLNRPIAVAKPFGLISSPVQQGDAIRFAGYPGRTHSDGYTLHDARGAITSVDGALANYDIATFKSNSGGPVWRETESGPELVAIHVTNSGGRVVDPIYIAEIERLIAELDRRAAERGF